jgi:uncharacterized membrane protein YgcG
VGDGFCCPSGKERCGSEYCYDPTSEQCCSSGQGSCPKSDSCCEYECCRSVATCAADGFCSASTCVETSTYSSTAYYAVHTVSVTQVAPPDGEEEAPEFSCAEITATNSAGDTLELGDNCLLTFSPSAAASSSSSSSSSGPSARAVPAEGIPDIQPRATTAAEDAACLYTSTSISTYTVRAISTVTRTVTSEEPDESFSCPPMTVTNTNGDELSLNEECSLEFSANTDSATATGGSGGSSGGGSSGGGSSGGNPSWGSSNAVPRVLMGTALLILGLAVAL